MAASTKIRANQHLLAETSPVGDAAPSLPAVPPAVPPAAPAATPPARPLSPAAARVERVSWVDYLLIGLAIVSLGLVIAEQVAATFLQREPQVLRWMIIADLVICGVFAIEFFARMRHQPSKWAYTKSRWYDVLGMIPVSHPFFRGFRLLRIVRIAVITSRFVRATNRSFGEMLFESTVRRFRDILVDVIGGAIMVRSIRVVQPWLANARFAERIGEAMEERRTDIRQMVHDSMGRLPGGKLLGMRPMRTAVDLAEAAAVQAVIDVLKSDELNRLVQQSTDNLLTELGTQVSETERARASKAA